MDSYDSDMHIFCLYDRKCKRRSKNCNKGYYNRERKTYAIEQTFSGKATFKTSNKKIAVIKNGKIIGKSIGKAKITIKDKGNTYIYKITVAKAYLNQNEIIVNVGKTVNLKIKGMKGKVKWSSLNKKVATVKMVKLLERKQVKRLFRQK